MSGVGENFAIKSAAQLVAVVNVAASTIDQQGNAQPSVDLVKALRALDERQRQVMGTGIAYIRGCRARNRPIPTQEIVGEELAPVLTAMNEVPPETLILLATGLDRPDLNDEVLWHPPQADHTP